MAMVDSVEVEQFEIVGSFVACEEFPKQRIDEASRLCLFVFSENYPWSSGRYFRCFGKVSALKQLSESSNEQLVSAR